MEWEGASIEDLIECPRVAGPYRFCDKELGNADLVMTAEQEYLEPPKVALVKADPSRGFTVHWAPVKGAIGYQVTVYGDNPPHTTWKNSRLDWLKIGWREALETGVLLSNTQSTVPAGIFHGPGSVHVAAVSREVRGIGDFPAVGWAESSFSIEVGAR